jgi:hypothetical protein
MYSRTLSESTSIPRFKKSRNLFGAWKRDQHYELTVSSYPL